MTSEQTEPSGYIIRTVTGRICVIQKPYGGSWEHLPSRVAEHGSGTMIYWSHYGSSGGEILALETFEECLRKFGIKERRI